MLPIPRAALLLAVLALPASLAGATRVRPTCAPATRASSRARRPSPAARCSTSARAPSCSWRRPPRSRSARVARRRSRSWPDSITLQPGASVVAGAGRRLDRARLPPAARWMLRAQRQHRGADRRERRRGRRGAAVVERCRWCSPATSRRAAAGATRSAVRSSSTRAASLTAAGSLLASASGNGSAGGSIDVRAAGDVSSHRQPGRFGRRLRRRRDRRRVDRRRRHHLRAAST